MSLTITAYKGVTLINKPALDEHGDILGETAKQVVISVGNSDWEQGDDLIKGQVYTYDDAMSVIKMPCGSFNDLRDELARIAGYKPLVLAHLEQSDRQYIRRVWKDVKQDKRGLLYELLNFADNEGEIGTKTCRKILSDLHAVSKNIDDLSTDHMAYLVFLIRTFSFAAVDGFVQFS